MLHKILVVAWLYLFASVSAAPFVPRKSVMPSVSTDESQPMVALDLTAPMVRGGAAPVKKPAKKEEWTLAQKFLAFSAVAAGGGGIMTILDWDSYVKYMWPGLKGVVMTEQLKYFISASLFGWTVGKYLAIKGGPAATKEFASLNAIALLPVILYAKAGGEWDVPVWIVFELLYIYFGYIEK